jgi:hypothetical protein
MPRYIIQIPDEDEKWATADDPKTAVLRAIKYMGHEWLLNQLVIRESFDHKGTIFYEVDMGQFDVGTEILEY